MARPRVYAGMVAAVLICAALLVPPWMAAGSSRAINAESIGLVEPDKLKVKYPDYIRLVELMKAYDSEFNAYAVYINNQGQSYLTELKRKMQEETVGKSAAEKVTIEAKYAEIILAKQEEVRKLIQAKFNDLQAKLSAESTKADEKVRLVVKDIAAGKGLDIVFSGAAVYYGGTDITDAVTAKAK